MSLLSHSVKLLIPPNENFTPTDLAEHLASVIYNEELHSVRERVDELPEPLKSIILVIDFDTELSINGILGFLENSSGKHLHATIQTFKLIDAKKDAAILENIQKRIKGVDFTAEIELKPSQITTFEQRHSIDEKVLIEIEELAEQLYLSSEGRNIFDYLINYLADDWSTKLKELKQICE